MLLNDQEIDPTIEIEAGLLANRWKTGDEAERFGVAVAVWECPEDKRALLMSLIAINLGTVNKRQDLLPFMERVVAPQISSWKDEEEAAAKGHGYA